MTPDERVKLITKPDGTRQVMIWQGINLLGVGHSETDVFEARPEHLIYRLRRELQSDIDAAVAERTEWCAKLIEDIRLAGGTGIEPCAAGDLPVALDRNSLLKCLVFAIRQGPSPLSQHDHPEHVGEVVPGEEEQPDGLPASVSSTENERSE